MNVKRIVRIVLLVVAAGFLGRPLPAQTKTPEQIKADEANIERICAKARKAYEDAKAEYLRVEKGDFSGPLVAP